MHGIIKANLPLPTNIYHAPFCGFTAGVYKVNLKLVVEKQKAHKERKVVLHIALIEPKMGSCRNLKLNFYGVNIENVGNVHRKLMVLSRLHIKFSRFMCNLVLFCFCRSTNH
jgi:CO dehydrogenase/acetyl-CoA synthase beta subunit